MLLKGFIQKKMARNAAHSTQYRFIADAASAQSLHHAFAQTLMAIRILQGKQNFKG